MTLEQSWDGLLSKGFKLKHGKHLPNDEFGFSPDFEQLTPLVKFREM